ncbi:MAG: hypothetical protein ACK4K7_11555 [Allosphingosinicella sp.]|uniref:hypothetical protein n=1 Tax=Allosphingosinicella sp. TaxID=2823234 RepID=UPI0039296051
MTCYRLLMAQPDRPGFLDEATIDQDEGAILLAHEYRASAALELWQEPSSGDFADPVNDNSAF